MVYFTKKKKKKIEALSMGSDRGPSLANLFFSNHEKKTNKKNKSTLIAHNDSSHFLTTLYQWVFFSSNRISLNVFQ